MEKENIWQAYFIDYSDEKPSPSKLKRTGHCSVAEWDWATTA